jgi:hypothetical protein
VARVAALDSPVAPDSLVALGFLAVLVACRRDRRLVSPARCPVCLG